MSQEIARRLVLSNGTIISDKASVDGYIQQARTKRHPDAVAMLQQHDLTPEQIRPTKIEIIGELQEDYGWGFDTETSDLLYQEPDLVFEIGNETGLLAANIYPFIVELSQGSVTIEVYAAPNFADLANDLSVINSWLEKSDLSPERRLELESKRDAAVLALKMFVIEAINSTK